MYTRVKSGTTCERVTSKAECEQAARQLGLSVTVAKVVTESDWPPNCYFYNGDSHGNGKTLYFNNDHNAASECNPGSRVCICQNSYNTLLPKAKKQFTNDNSPKK